MTAKKILVLFTNEWDTAEFASSRYAGRYQFIFEGFDLFKFPENAWLMLFDARRFIERIVSRFGDAGIEGVVSTDEHFGTMIAAIIAERLGVPGGDVESILIAQHKYYARVRQREIAPEATPAFSYFPYQIDRAEDTGLAFPFYVKPVKATYSILARRVDNFAELKRHLTFGFLEKHILEKLIKPFNDLGSDRRLFPIDARHLVAEALLEGDQVTVEGFFDRGQLTMLGVVDSIMYPGTSAFQRFDYPSHHPIDVQRRMEALTERVMRGFGFNHGFFNVELFYNRVSDRIQLLEVNPRMAYQFADLREKVDGFNPYEALLDLAVGVTPKVVFGAGRYRHAASFVLRKFGRARLRKAPSAAELYDVRRRHHDARLMVYVKKGASLERELKWLGSYRYAVLNLGAMDRRGLFDRFHAVSRELAFDFA
ncbi:MAG: acetyl-CoA carboxylase biotin carboxylase subunit family protein [Burkholderiales bacterium]